MSEDLRENPAQNAVIKVIVLGDAATGKTSFIRRFVYDTFEDHHRTTIGVDFALKAVTIDGITVRVQLWDIAGQEHFRALNRVYYRDALGALLIYDVTKPESFDNILKWKKEIDAKVELPNQKPLPVILCENKCDLKQDIDHESLDEFCDANNFTNHFETSAKENTNVEEAIKALIAGILKHRDIFKKREEKRGFQPSYSDQTRRMPWCCSSF